MEVVITGNDQPTMEADGDMVGADMVVMDTTDRKMGKLISDIRTIERTNYNA